MDDFLNIYLESMTFNPITVSKIFKDEWIKSLKQSKETRLSTEHDFIIDKSFAPGTRLVSFNITFFTTNNESILKKKNSLKLIVYIKADGELGSYWDKFELKKEFVDHKISETVNLFASNFVKKLKGKIK